jgi:hypothetical protein
VRLYCPAGKPFYDNAADSDLGGLILQRRVGAHRDWISVQSTLASIRLEMMQDRNKPTRGSAAVGVNASRSL